MSEYLNFSIDRYAIKKQNENTTKNFLNFCYIKDMVDGKIFKFQLLPKSFDSTKVTNWENVEVPGRSVPLKFYRSSDSETINLQLQLVTSMFQGDNMENEIYDAIQFLKSMPYPDYSGSFVKPPHYFQLVMGNTLSGEGMGKYKYYFVVKEVKVEYNLPYDFDSKKSMYVKADLEIEEVRNAPYGLHDVRIG